MKGVTPERWESAWRSRTRSSPSVKAWLAPANVCTAGRGRGRPETAQVDHGQRGGRRRADDLDRRPVVALHEHAAQRLVAPLDLGEATAERAGAQPARDARELEDVVLRAAGLEPVEEPE